MKKFIMKMMCSLLTLSCFITPISAHENEESVTLTNTSSKQELVETDTSMEFPMVSKERYTVSGNAGTLRMDYTRQAGFRYWVKINSGRATDFYGQLHITGPKTDKIIYLSGLYGQFYNLGLKKGTIYSASITGTAYDVTGHAVGFTMDNSYTFTY